MTVQWERENNGLSGRDESLALPTMYLALPNPLKLLSTLASLSANVVPCLDFLVVFLLQSFIVIVEPHELCIVHISFVSL